MTPYKEWINKAIETAHRNAIKRDVYGDNPETAIIEKLKEEVLELQDASESGNYGVLIGNVTPEVFERFVKNSIPDELADIVIVCLAAAKELGIDLITHIDMKNHYNSKRLK